jgi:hypothetical protein
VQPTPTTSAPKPTFSPPPAPPAREPQGEVVLGEWHNLAGDLTCALVQTFYDNRSDTPVLSVTQTFTMSYTPKHRLGEYPGSVDGPSKTLTQSAGIAPYTVKELQWEVCAPELADLQNPPRPDGTDSWVSEVGALPKALDWKWTQ